MNNRALEKWASCKKSPGTTPVCDSPNEAYLREFNKGKSFEYSQWQPLVTYTNDSVKQDFVRYNNTILACKCTHVASDPPELLYTSSGVAIGVDSDVWEFVISQNAITNYYYIEGTTKGIATESFVNTKILLVSDEISSLRNYAQSTTNIANTAHKEASIARSEISSLNTYTKREVEKLNTDIDDLDDTVSEIKDLIGDEYHIWFEIESQKNDIPTLGNFPANNWVSDEDYYIHDRDLYYSISLGRAWRFNYNEGAPIWEDITDSFTIAALTKAEEAVNIANEAINAVNELQLTKHKIINIDNSNVDEFFPIATGEGTTSDGKSITRRSLIPDVFTSITRFGSTFSKYTDISIYLPAIHDFSLKDELGEFTSDELRELAGNTFYIYNNSSAFIHLCGYSYDENNSTLIGPVCFGDGIIKEGEFAKITCILDVISGKEILYWKYKIGRTVPIG